DHHPHRAARPHESAADPADPAPQGQRRWALRHVRRRGLQWSGGLVSCRAQPGPHHHRRRSHLVLLRRGAGTAHEGQVRQL
ncbi:MAG: Protein translocase membrane subunit SecG, partial [uncultured Nocardioidaceae bacterium]